MDSEKSFGRQQVIIVLEIVRGQELFTVDHAKDYIIIVCLDFAYIFKMDHNLV